MRVRRAIVATGVTLTMALTSAAALGGSAGASAPEGATTKAPTTGRLITASKKGIVLVDEDGGKRRTLIPARGEKADIVDMQAETGVFLWSTGSGRKKTWHVSNLFGAEFSTFRLPKSASTPAIDSGGYEVFWVRQGSATTNAAVMAWALEDPLAGPRVIRELAPGTASAVSLSPDYQWVSVVLSTATGSQVQLVSRDGATLRTVPTTGPGASVYSDRAVFSSDSGQVAYLSGVAPGPVGAAYIAPVAGDYAPRAVGAAFPSLFDWSPDDATLLGGSPDGGSLTGYSAANGTVVATYPVKRTSGTGVFWSGLPAGASPLDRTRPDLTVTKPAKDTVREWSTVRGTASDKGGALLRYVVFKAFQKRGSAWWGLVGNGKHPTWKKFPNRIEAKLYAKERRAKIIDDTWSLGIPGMRAGRLVLVVKAADGAGNNRTRELAVDVS